MKSPVKYFANTENRKGSYMLFAKWPNNHSSHACLLMLDELRFLCTEPGPCTSAYQRRLSGFITCKYL